MAGPNLKTPLYSIRIRRWRYLFLAVVLVWLFVGWGRSAAQQTVTLEAYLSAISQYRGQILRAANDTEQCQAAMTAVANVLTGITAVQFPDGSVMRVNHQGVSEALQSQPCNPARADQYLSGLCPSQLCPVSRPASFIHPAANSQNGDSLASAAGGVDGEAPGAVMPTAAVPAAATPLPAQTSVGETDQPADLPRPANEQPVPTTEVSGETMGAEGSASSERASSETASNETSLPDDAATLEDTTDTTTLEDAAPSGNVAPSEDTLTEEDEATFEDADFSEDGTSSEDAGGFGDADSSEDMAATEDTAVSGETTDPGQALPTTTASSAALTPEASHTPAVGTPTATAVPIPQPAPTPDTPETRLARNRWLLLVIGLVALGLIGTAVALLWRQNDEEAEEETTAKKEKAAEVMTAVSEGRQLAEKGDYREAARRLFLAMLLALDEKGFVRFDRNRTNLELLQQERLYKEIIPSLIPIITTYERVWYGLEPLPAAEYERLVNEIKAIRDWRRNP